MVVSMERWRGKVAVVTGASSGIGAATVEKLVEEGMLVAGLARRVDRMKDLEKKLIGKKGKFYPVKCDMAEEANILEAFKYVTNNIGPIHVLVNNAGVAHNTTLANGDTELWKNVLTVNILGVCIATREAVKDMQKNKVDGHIIHMNSITGHYIPPAFDTLNVYPATKHAITALTESLRQEFVKSKTKIKITSISPGVVMTEIFEVGGIDVEKIKEVFGGGDLPYMKPEDIADGIIYILSTPPYVNVTELTIRPVNEPI